MKMNFNPIALFGLIGLFGMLGPLTGNVTWYWWFAWFLWFGNYNKPTDERFFKNISKTGIICFAIAMLSLMIILFMKELSISKDIIYNGIEIIFTACGLTFVFLLRYFEESDL